MSWNWNSRGLPFFPGYTFQDPTKSAFHRPNTLVYKNGYALPRRPTVGIGQSPLVSKQLIEQKISALSFERPDVTYDSFDNSQSEAYIPSYVVLDKKVLRYYGYFEENILYSRDEEYRIRPVVIVYFLEDDTMCVTEPPVENSGMPHGKLIKRQHLPKNEQGAQYRWTDLNIGIDLEVYGVKYHITHCDAFTKEFMESEGIHLNDPEEMPVDPYTAHRKKPFPCYTTPSDFDRLHQFLTMDRKVLRFFALWSDPHYGETRPVTITYYLVDDTVEVREADEPNGRIPFPVLMRRQKLPKKLKDSQAFPTCVLEVSKEEVDEYYSPKDFHVGQTITLLGRNFQICDCDRFTKEYYGQCHPDIEMKPIEKTEKVPERKKEFPPYNGFGSLEDTLQNCLSLIPKQPKKNLLQLLENDHKVLRYSARMESQFSEDEGRRFVLSYFLANDMISIYEKPTRNSGIISGKFLEKTRISKPGSTVDHPEFYSPADLAIGSTVEVFNHRFVLTDADQYVLTYLESIASQIPSQTLESLRQKLGVRSTINEPNGEDSAAETPVKT